MMRSLALSLLCATPPLLAACGDNLSPPVDDDPPAGSDQSDSQSDPQTDPQSGSHGTPRAIAAFLDISSPSCDAATAGFEAFANYTDDSSSVANARCRITFDDGATSDSCVGEHTFASPGAHTFVLELSDPATGATAQRSVTRTIATPLTVDLALDVPACGLDVGFTATLSTGAEVHVTMSPPESVAEFHIAGRSGTFHALAPGDYTIHLTAEDERPTGPICFREVTRTITLTACPDC